MTSRAQRELRARPCTCGKGRDHWEPHKKGCPRHRDLSQAREIRDALIKKRHLEKEGEWINLAEFHRIDLFAFRLWQEFPDAKFKVRVGITVPFHRRVAYEIKTSRSDFRAEIRRPGKRATALALTHQFFFATPAGLVRKDEIPDECGLVVLDGDEIKVVKRAPIRKPERNLKTSDVVAMLRAKQLGRNTYEVRRKLAWAEDRLKRKADEEAVRERLLSRARAAMIRERGHLLVHGSEWIGPYPWHLFGAKKQREDVRVRVKQVHVYEGYDKLGDADYFGRAGTVDIEPVTGQGFSEWDHDGIDPGDFLISFRHESEPPKPAPPPSRPGVRNFEVVEGSGEGNGDW